MPPAAVPDLPARPWLEARGDLSQDADPKRTLLIASTARSGSSLLGACCRATGALGYPVEYAHPVDQRHLEARFGVEGLQPALREIMKRRTSPNGVFGIKVHYPVIAQFGSLPNLLDFFPGPGLVHIGRRDTVAQAVSMARGLQTGRWSARGPAEGARVETDAFDYDLVDACHRRLVRHAAGWRYELAKAGRPFLSIDTEDLTADWRVQIARIADFMQVDIDVAALPDSPPTEPMPKDPAIADWADRYRAAARHRPLFPEEPLPGEPNAPRRPPGVMARLRRRARIALKGR